MVVLVLGAIGCDGADCPQSITPSRDIAKPTIGVCTSLGNADLLYAAGYDYIEENVQQFLKPFESADVFAANLQAATSAALPIYAYAIFLPGDLKCVGPTTQHDRILDYARTVFERAVQTGSSIIVFGSGGARRVPDGFSHDKAIEQFTDLLRRLGPIAAEFDIIVAVEPLNKNECNLINTITAGAKIVRAVDHTHIQLVADFYHMAVEGEGPESIIEAGPLIAHVHIAEKDRRAAPGTAGFDFVPYFAALRQIGYTGGISIECRWQNFDAELAPALVYVNEQLAEAWKK